MLLYVTCSVFKVENEEQVSAFMACHVEAKLADMPAAWGRGQIGRQVLPGDDGMDGFYFALLMKQ
jgi:16S rRNA (cytosine967-C5)-methyltransferase